jgi:mannose-6-phosphate isomerase-like protein (cupin superfamily)
METSAVLSSHGQQARSRSVHSFGSNEVAAPVSTIHSRSTTMKSTIIYRVRYYWNKYGLVIVAFGLGWLLGGRTRNSKHHLAASNASFTLTRTPLNVPTDHSSFIIQYEPWDIKRSGLTPSSTIQLVPTSHAGVFKQVLLLRGMIPNVMQCAIATIQYPHFVEMHSHESMYEFFYVLKGSGNVRIGSNTTLATETTTATTLPKYAQQEYDYTTKTMIYMYSITPGFFFSIPPKTAHSLHVSPPIKMQYSESSLHLLYCGVDAD